tara:strand:- start:1146 stop:1307 length:162 start_codon:yes stop_codon:yes gene_type:complete
MSKEIKAQEEKLNKLQEELALVNTKFEFLSMEFGKLIVEFNAVLKRMAEKNKL